VPRCKTHLFGNPAILNLRTRGFASPDYSGFALSENLSLVAANVELLADSSSTKRSKIDEDLIFSLQPTE
jgi:hypothetical protein